MQCNWFLVTCCLHDVPLLTPIVLVSCWLLAGGCFMPERGVVLWGGGQGMLIPLLPAVAYCLPWCPFAALLSDCAPPPEKPPNQTFPNSLKIMPPPTAQLYTVVPHIPLPLDDMDNRTWQLLSPSTVVQSTFVS